jgi:hypothetical protein
MQKTNRIKLIKKIISYKDVTDKIFADLLSYKWDFEENPALLDANDIARVLKLYLDQKITAQDIEKWANFLECRDDVHAHESIADILFELANPDIEGELTESRAKSILLEL